MKIIKSLFIYIIIIFLVFTLLKLFIENENTKKILTEIDFTKNQPITITQNGEKKVILSDPEKVQEFNNILQKIITSKVDMSKMKREIRQIYFIDFENPDERLRLSFVPDGEYIVLFYKGSTLCFSVTNSFCSYVNLFFENCMITDNSKNLHIPHIVFLARCKKSQFIS